VSDLLLSIIRSPDTRIPAPNIEGLSMPHLSVVIPVYGCADCLTALHGRLTSSLEKISPDWEILYVDDRSPDGCWHQLTEFAGADSRVRAYRLSRNFGQHAAITAGLAHSRGDWTVVMDCDLQDPPEDIPRLYEKAIDGHDVVLTQRDRRTQGPLRRMASRTYFRARKAFFNTDMGSGYSTLSILSRKVVDAFLSVRDRDRQYLLILHWLGFDHASIEVSRTDRHAGGSSYTWGGLIKVGLDGMFFQTTVLLRWIVYLGFAVAFAGSLLAAFLVYAYFVSDPLPGWTSVAVLTLLIGGFVIVSTGVSALYVGKVFEQVKQRPLYVIDRIASGGIDESVDPEVAEQTVLLP
jgi:glycosyltransferase involved in cell wall biosynthesis